jgi:tRNA-2-methylthio-N6-dimethylallyladenosine synthase
VKAARIPRPTASLAGRATTRVTYAAPHHLVADDVLGLRRTRAGDAWEAGQAVPVRPAAATATTAPVLLGMPRLGIPQP